MNETIPPPPVLAAPPPASSWKKPALLILAAILGCCALTAVGTAWWVKRNFYASPLSPVQLSVQEQAALERKLEALEVVEETAVTPPAASDPREISLTAKEINAFLAQQGLGDQIKVDLSRDRIAASFIVPVDKDFPVIGGTTLRFRLALGALIDAAGKFVLKIDDVTVGGIPVPNAWLGDMKGLDLVTANLDSEPAVRRFVEGIKEFEVREGSLRVRLNE